MFAERFRSLIELRCSMRTCLTCGTEIPDSRRKDARFCLKPACRARDFRRRKRETQVASTPRTHANAAETFTVTCSCGSQILIQVTHLKGTDSLTPTLNQPGMTEAVTQSVANGMDARETLTSIPSSSAETVTPNSSPTASPEGVAITTAGTNDRKPTQCASVLSPPVTGTGSATGSAPLLPIATVQVRWTCELFGVLGRSRVIPLKRALIDRQDGHVELIPGNDLAMGRTRSDGHGLSGSPGAWPEFYPNTSPAAFGLDADLALVYWDDLGHRAVPVPVSVAEQLIGDDWREQIRAGLRDWL